jgi:hypothetical protein
MSKISVAVTNDFCPQTLFVYGTRNEDGKPNFGLFCWFSYCWLDQLGVICAIGGSKRTLANIRRNGVFSANLVVEDNLPLLSRSEELHQRFSHELLTSIDIALHMSRRERWQSARQWLSYLDTSSEQRKKEPVKPRPKSVASRSAKPGARKKNVGKLRRMMSNRGWLALRRKPLPVVFPNNSRSVEDSHTPEKIGRAIMGGIIGGCCGVSAGARFEVSPESGIGMAIVGVLIGAICGFISGPQD